MRRATYHRRFVETPELLVCASNDSKVSIVLRKQTGWISLVGIESTKGL